MGWNDVRVQLDDGAVIELPRQAAEEVYDLLWGLGPDVRGAVTAAAKLHRSLRAGLTRETADLDALESEAFIAVQRRLAT